MQDGALLAVDHVRHGEHPVDVVLGARGPGLHASQHEHGRAQPAKPVAHLPAHPPKLPEFTW